MTQLMSVPVDTLPDQLDGFNFQNNLNESIVAAFQMEAPTTHDRTVRFVADRIFFVRR